MKKLLNLGEYMKVDEEKILGDLKYRGPEWVAVPQENDIQYLDRRIKKLESDVQNLYEMNYKLIQELHNKNG